MKKNEQGIIVKLSKKERHEFYKNALGYFNRGDYHYLCIVFKNTMELVDFKTYKHIHEMLMADRLIYFRMLLLEFDNLIKSVEIWYTYDAVWSYSTDRKPFIEMFIEQTKRNKKIKPL